MKEAEARLSGRAQRVTLLDSQLLLAQRLHFSAFTAIILSYEYSETNHA